MLQKYTFSLKRSKNLRPIVKKILRICLNNFCEFPPRPLNIVLNNRENNLGRLTWADRFEAPGRVSEFWLD